MKVTFCHEAPRFGNQSHLQTYEIDAVMLDRDRVQRAMAAGKPVDDVPARIPQAIFDEMWRDEENVAHQAYRRDRGTGKATCACGLGCKLRRGCRAPKNHPWSLDTMFDYGVDPTGIRSSVEDTLIFREGEAQVRGRKSCGARSHREASSSASGSARTDVR